MEVVYGSKHLSFNKFSLFPLFPNKHTLGLLVLGNNHIFSVRQLSILEHIKELDLRKNVIASFDEMDEIAEIFSNLAELRINDLPVFESLTSEEMTLHFIGRLVCEPWMAKLSPNSISKLNGTFLQQLKIMNAELYFIPKVRS